MTVHEAFSQSLHQVFCRSSSDVPRGPSSPVFKSRAWISLTFGVEAAASLFKTHQRRWGASPPTCADGLEEEDGRFDTTNRRNRARLLKIGDNGPLGQ